MTPPDIPEVDLGEFAKLIGLEQIAPGRYSVLLAAHLLGGALSGVQNPAKIIREIDLLEKNERGQFKPPIKNRHPPLKGLWHKHYLQDGLASFAMNVEKGLNQCGMPFFETKVQEAKDAGELRYLTPEDVPALVDDVISGNRQRLAERQALSGEWIVFARHEGQNYYLTVATHDRATHDQVREQIDEVCSKEFPFLTQMLNEA
ncbi:hypothetical protein JJQ97_22930 [Pseudomonas syringae]|uniref:hypothetical protein n=1 Tax=Pseudomonas syringae TaxID=317 RepID=UPI0019173975|nr:hypothetical protein [Pseudomonas syringae]QQQ50146.1 hypothetical protein JJQ97_22930 [Pseudomonas syringae]